MNRLFLLAAPMMAVALGLVAGVPTDALAQDAAAAAAPAPTLSSGDTAWMLMSTVLVLFMTIPGLALFYGGMVRKMNVLSTVMQSFAICCLMSILWIVAGYSIAFTEGTPYFGGFSKVLLNGLTKDSLSGVIPETVFITFQMTFAIITPALITGAFADRMKFSSMLVFMAVWSLLVYAPLGRTGVYPMQEALRGMTEGLPPAEKVALARRLIQQLPASNWLLNNPFVTDHRQADANLYDLLLHSCDRPYSVGELAALAESAGLAVGALIDPARYEPATWIKDPRILKRLDGLSWLERAAWTERITGGMTKHIAYLLRPADLAGAIAQPDGPDVVPVLRDLDGPALAKSLPPGGSLEVELQGGFVALPLPRLAGPILARADGKATLGEIHAAVAATAGVTWDAFLMQFQQLFKALGGVGKMHLRR